MLLADLRVGDPLPPFERDVTSEDLVRFAGASGDFARQHWDHVYMVERGFPGVIVHGWLTFSVMSEALARWISPEQAQLTSFEVRYRHVHLPGRMRCGGDVTVIDALERTAHIALWAQDAAGVRTTTAQVALKFFDETSP